MFFSTFAPSPLGSPGVSAFRPLPLPPPSLCLIKLKRCHLVKPSFLGLFGWVFSFSPSGAVMNFLSASLAFPTLLSPELALWLRQGVQFLAVMERADSLFRNQKDPIGTALCLSRQIPSRSAGWMFVISLIPGAGAHVCVCVCVCVCVNGVFASSSLGALPPFLTLVLTLSLSHFEI